MGAAGASGPQLPGVDLMAALGGGSGNSGGGRGGGGAARRLAAAAAAGATSAVYRITDNSTVLAKVAQQQALSGGCCALEQTQKGGSRRRMEQGSQGRTLSGQRSSCRSALPTSPSSLCIHCWQVGVPAGFQAQYCLAGARWTTGQGSGAGCSVWGRAWLLECRLLQCRAAVARLPVHGGALHLGHAGAAAGTLRAAGADEQFVPAPGGLGAAQRQRG